MVSAGGRDGPPLGPPLDRPLESQLFAEPQRFGFFQAVRLLERLFSERSRDDPRLRRSPVGGDVPPEEEVVRFRGAAALHFPATEVATIEDAQPADAERGLHAVPPTMTVNFLGLAGPSGVLPDHYTEHLLVRLRRKDRAFRDFLDLFQHRAVSRFHRAWEKYRLPFRHERAAAAGRADEAVWTLQCLVGRGTRGHTGRLTVHDDAFLWFSGHFARRTRTASALEEMLNDYFELPVRIVQFEGEWLGLGLDQRSVLPTSLDERGRFNRLGHDTILGAHVWDVQGRFRVRVGPLRYTQFREFMPGGTLLDPFCDFTRAYVGAEFAFDVQPVLAPREAIPCCLGSDVPDRPRLGWNTWLRTKDVEHEFDDVAFTRERL